MEFPRPVYDTFDYSGLDRSRDHSGVIFNTLDNAIQNVMRGFETARRAEVQVRAAGYRFRMKNEQIRLIGLDSPQTFMADFKKFHRELDAEIMKDEGFLFRDELRAELAAVAEEEATMGATYVIQGMNAKAKLNMTKALGDMAIRQPTDAFAQGLLEYEAAISRDRENQIPVHITEVDQEAIIEAAWQEHWNDQVNRRTQRLLKEGNDARDIVMAIDQKMNELYRVTPEGNRPFRLSDRDRANHIALARQSAEERDRTNNDAARAEWSGLVAGIMKSGGTPEEMANQYRRANIATHRTYRRPLEERSTDQRAYKIELYRRGLEMISGMGTRGQTDQTDQIRQYALRVWWEYAPRFISQPGLREGFAAYLKEQILLKFAGTDYNISAVTDAITSIQKSIIEPPTRLANEGIKSVAAFLTRKENQDILNELKAQQIFPDTKKFEELVKTHGGDGEAVANALRGYSVYNELHQQLFTYAITPMMDSNGTIKFRSQDEVSQFGKELIQIMQRRLDKQNMDLLMNAMRAPTDQQRIPQRLAVDRFVGRHRYAPLTGVYGEQVKSFNEALQTVAGRARAMFTDPRQKKEQFDALFSETEGGRLESPIPGMRRPRDKARILDMLRTIYETDFRLDEFGYPVWSFRDGARNRNITLMPYDYAVPGQDPRWGYALAFVSIEEGARQYDVMQKLFIPAPRTTLLTDRMQELMDSVYLP